MLISALIVATNLLQPIAEMAPVGRCIPGPHEQLRVRRQPFMPMTSAKPRNPLEDAYPHCAESANDPSEQPS